MRFKSSPWMLVKNEREVKFRPPFETMVEMLEHWAQKQPERTAIDFVDVDDDNGIATARRGGPRNDAISYSWRELKEKVLGAAEILKQRGLKSGDTISFGYHNHPNILILSLGAWVSGIKTAPLDLKRDDREMMKYKLELSGAKIVFREGDEWDKSYKDYKNYKLREKIPLSAEALVLFTSGTTAKPKGALLTQENLAANADGIADWLEINSSDRFMILLPLHHINSTTMSLATLLRGGTIVLLSRYSNSRFFEIAARTGATLTSVVPTIIHDQLERIRENGIATARRGGPRNDGLRLTRIQLGSAPVVAKEAEEFVKLTGIPLVQGYGQTETALRSTGAGWSWKNLRSNTIGEEMKWTNVTILSLEGSEGKEGREGGRQLPEGQEGEISIRGPVIMKEYLKNPAATKEAFKYGWFHSGDLGYWKIVDGKRQFFIKGRIKEIIIKAGVNVSPMAVEEKILKSVPGVDQVYVVGIPDERVGEEIGAVAVWKEEGRRKKEEGRRRRGISEFETPKYWFLMAAEKLPMTSTGKVQRVKLREMFKECAAIAETDKYMFRVISAAEEEMIEAARQMYNRYWAPLAADKKDWQGELNGKILIGAFNKETGELAGWIRIKEEGKTITADAVTAAGQSLRGALATKQSQRDCHAPPRQTRLGLAMTKGVVETYLEQKIDPVIEFHRRAKAWWKQGAKFVKVVENARPGDTPALGYGVLMEYPEFAKMPAPRLTDSTLGTMLLEAGLVYAKKRGFKRVRVLSRPVGLWRWIRGEGRGGLEGKEGRDRGIYRNLREIKGDKR